MPLSYLSNSADPQWFLSRFLAIQKVLVEVDLLHVRGRSLTASRVTISQQPLSNSFTESDLQEQKKAPMKWLKGALPLFFKQPLVHSLQIAPVGLAT